MDTDNHFNMQYTSQVLTRNSNNLSNFNNSTSVEIPTDGLYNPPTGLVILLSIFYGSISFLAVVGNFLVIWIVATSKRMQNVTNCFIANLALSDIVIGLFSIPFQFQAALLQRWNLPEFMCPFCPFVQVLSVSVSVFTLTAIAIDRHRAILYPLSARPSKKLAKIIIAGIWILATIVATPMMIALRVVMAPENELKPTELTKPFCDTTNMSPKSMQIYRTILLFLQYIVPLFVISFVYARMAIVLWGSKAPGNAEDSRDATLIKNKKKVIKMLVIVVLIFALCWLPLQTYQVLQTLFEDINSYRYINIIFFCFDWLAMSNSCYNPFIYGIYNEKFKKEFKSRFPCCNQRIFRNNSTMNNCNLVSSNSTTSTRVSRYRLDIIKTPNNFQKSMRIPPEKSPELEVSFVRTQIHIPPEGTSPKSPTKKRVDLLVRFGSPSPIYEKDSLNMLARNSENESFISSEACLHSEATETSKMSAEKLEDN